MLSKSILTTTQNRKCKELEAANLTFVSCQFISARISRSSAENLGLLSQVKTIQKECSVHIWLCNFGSGFSAISHSRLRLDDVDWQRSSWKKLFQQLSHWANILNLTKERTAILFTKRFCFNSKIIDDIDRKQIQYARILLSEKG